MERNNKIVINPLGAINTKGLTADRKILSIRYRTIKMANVIPTAQIMVLTLKSSFVFDQEPK